jgi:hypothetical protein
MMFRRTKNLEAIIKNQEEIISNQSRQVIHLQHQLEVAENLMVSWEVLKVTKIALDKRHVIVDN